MVGQSCQGKEQIGKSVQVHEEECWHLIQFGQTDHTSLGAAADGAGKVQTDGLLAPGWQHERLQRWRFGVGRIDRGFEQADPVGGELRLLERLAHLVGIGRGKMAADGEEVLLD